MDRFVCQCEAYGDIDITTIIKGLKRRFPNQLRHFVVTEDAVQRRVMRLDLMENDYFKAGMEAGLRRLESAGIVLPPMNLEKYSKKASTDEGIIEVSC